YAEESPNRDAGTPRDVGEFVELRLQVADVKRATVHDDTPAHQRAEDRPRLSCGRERPLRRGGIEAVDLPGEQINVLRLTQPTGVAPAFFESELMNSAGHA